jgi:L-seryl-tRNA(Ser) seleniumtransferase
MAGNPYPTPLGGARLHPEVAEAMREAAGYNIDMHQLLERAGKKIADMVGVEAAFITSGACAGLTLAAAAVMTGPDVRLMEQLPDTEHPVNMKNEIIMQLGHFSHFAACLKASGAKIIEVGGGYLPRGRMAGATWEEFKESWETAQDEGWLFHPLIYDETKKRYIRVFKVMGGHIENAINERTAAIAYVRSTMSVRGEYEVSLDETIRIAKKYNLPVIVDFAAEAYKKSHLRMALEKGADLVIFSGGKDIRGPNDTGIVLGRKEWIEAVKLNSTPHYRIIVGRGFKVSKEQIVGLVAAMEKYLEIDEGAEFKRDQDRCRYIASKFEGFPYVEASVYVPDYVPGGEIEGLFKFPVVHLKLDEKALGVKAADVAKLLWKGDPQINLNKQLVSWGIVEIMTHSLQDGDEDIVIERIKRILSKNLK